jgi:hypothetical protein
MGALLDCGFEMLAELLFKVLFKVLGTLPTAPGGVTVTMSRIRDRCHRGAR